MADGAKGLASVKVYETASCGAQYDGATHRIWKDFHLDSALRVSETYARTHENAPSAELEARFRNVLVTIEQVFGEQQQKLLENDVLDLDVQIEVLKTQLEKEGVA